MTDTQFSFLTLGIYFFIAFIVYLCTYAYIYKKYIMSNSRQNFDDWKYTNDYDCLIFVIPIFWPFSIIFCLFYFLLTNVNKIVKTTIEYFIPNKNYNKYDRETKI